jgi:hypothetical protein
MPGYQREEDRDEGAGAKRKPDGITCTVHVKIIAVLLAPRPASILLEAQGNSFFNLGMLGRRPLVQSDTYRSRGFLFPAFQRQYLCASANRE